jgi:hypothetical protein
MSKAILVIDMPESCDECPLFCGYYSDMYCKGIGNRGINYPYPKDFRQDWCPLKPMPEKIDVPDWDDSIKAKNENAEEVGMYMYDRGHYRGYNICVDKILGESKI